MKAITCSQCGAIITEFTEKMNYVSCEYCYSKIPIKYNKLIEISRREAERANRLRKAWKRRDEVERRLYQDKFAYEAEDHYKRMGFQMIVLLILIALPFILYFVFR